ncbi:glycerophosphodiester phosphodiesterase [Moraxella osloensis]|uniref:glycerophosphodiester phosphodiesterase n=1 Tax=Faucicola osloensis TaxID=34062 RepID=UPI00200548F7|nr:glycerophosphodiester phosphodiesterase [Moraxella osloensis]MCK6051414.1 glycerophosphodiester phosphodiesterase [Moraxella osloensis]
MRHPNQRYYLLGHRAARAEMLENCQDGFAYVQQLQKHGKQLDGVEFDIQMTADGKFVVVHDETLNRLAGQQSWIGDKTWTELDAIVQSDYGRFSQRFEPGFLKHHVLLLDDLPRYLQYFCHIELEIKTHAKTHPALLVKNLLRLLSQEIWKDLPITLTSFDTDILYQIQNQQQFLTFHFPTGLLLEPKTLEPKTLKPKTLEPNTTLAGQIAFLPTPDAAGKSLILQTFNRACALGCRQVGIYYALITPTLLEIAKIYGLTVSAWTVNEVDVAKRLIEMGVDCVITDYPTQFLTQLYEFNV